MEGEQAPSAPAQASEAPTNTNEEQTQAPAQAPMVNLTSEQAEAFNKFMEANGGFDKAFAKVKSAVSNPQPAEQKVEEPEQKPEQKQEVPVQAETPEGFLSRDEFVMQQYYYSLANDSKYNAISDKIRNGDIIKEMQKFGIRPAVNGNINDTQVRQFLDLYVKTVPTQAPANEVTNTPTVDYYDVGEKIDSLEKAYAVIQDNISRGNTSSHPKTQEANDFIKQYYANRH